MTIPILKVSAQNDKKHLKYLPKTYKIDIMYYFLERYFSLTLFTNTCDVLILYRVDYRKERKMK